MYVCIIWQQISYHITKPYCILYDYGTAAAGLFLYMLDYMVTSIAQDSGYGAVTQQRHNEVLKALAEKMDEINMMKRMLGGPRKTSSSSIRNSTR